jgi:roadblock/LC7 domain-containing protein
MENQNDPSDSELKHEINKSNDTNSNDRRITRRAALRRLGLGVVAAGFFTSEGFLNAVFADVKKKNKDAALAHSVAKHLSAEDAADPQATTETQSSQWPSDWWSHLPSNWWSYTPSALPSYPGPYSSQISCPSPTS